MLLRELKEEIDMKTKPTSYWNYRVVAEFHNHEKEVLRGWSFTIRDVYYTDDKPTSWGAEPQYPTGETTMEVFNDIENMQKAMYRPLLVIVNDELVEYPAKSSVFATASRLKSYEPKPLTVNN